MPLQRNMARIKYTTPGKRSTDPHRRREQHAQPVVPMKIEVIELSDDIQVVELSDDAAPTVEVAEEIEVSDATPTQAEGLA